MPTIAHVTSVHAQNDNRVRFKQCRGLREHGYDVVLVCADGESHTADDGVRVIAVDKPRSRFTRMFATGLRVVRRALKEKPDLLHFHDPELLPLAQFLRLTGHRVVFDMHENVPKATLDKSWIAKPLRPLIAGIVKALERVLMWRIPVVFAEVSYAEEYSWVGVSQTVQNFPDLRRILCVSEPKFERFSLVYMGGISEPRGSGVMRDVFERLRGRGLDIEMHLIGPGTLPEREGRGTPQSIVSHGYLPAEEGFRIVSRCHVGLAVLMPIANYVRSYPTKMFEYMALGLPIVVSDFPLYREALGDSGCGHLVDPLSLDDVERALADLIADPERARAMGQRGRKHVQEHYSWQNELGNLLRLYERLIDVPLPKVSS